MPNPQLIAVLERKLAEAKSGKLNSIGLVSCYDNGGLTVDVYGSNAGGVLAGTVQLMHQAREATFPVTAPVQ